MAGRLLDDDFLNAGGPAVLQSDLDLKGVGPDRLETRLVEGVLSVPYGVLFFTGWKSPWDVR